MSGKAEPLGDERGRRNPDVGRCQHRIDFGALRQLERRVTILQVDRLEMIRFIAGERSCSPELDGRSVFGWVKDLPKAKKVVPV